MFDHKKNKNHFYFYSLFLKEIFFCCKKILSTMRMLDTNVTCHASGSWHPFFWLRKLGCQLKARWHDAGESGLTTKRIFNKKLILFISIIFFSATVFANPVLDNVAAGNVSIQQTSQTTTINQASDKAIINWQSFNIGQQEHTHFQQPVNGVALNRINPTQGVSQIYGSLTATGKIILINPAGIYFGPTARVNVAGLIAATANLSDQDFLNGQYQFAKVNGYAGAIINEGILIAASNGLIALVAPSVINRGLIQANMGHIILASGEAFTLSFSPDNLINFHIDQATTISGIDQNGKKLNVGVENTGSLIAHAGRILVTAKTASQVLDKAINMQGIAEAKSVGVKNGEIILMAEGGKVEINNSQLNASGKNSTEQGGNIIVTGDHINIAENSLFDVSGTLGAGAILIGGDVQGSGLLPHAKSVFVSANSNFFADALTAGHGGKVIVWSDGETLFHGNIFARGGEFGGDGGFVETSGKYLDVANAFVDTLAAIGQAGLWLLDPTNIYIAVDQAAATLAGMIGTDNTANYATTPYQATGAIADSLLTTGVLQTALATSNVTVTTSNTPGTGAGNIFIVDPITWSSTRILTLTAANNIAINAAITTGAVGSGLVLNAVGNVTQTAAIGGDGNLTKQGAGTLTLSQANSYTGTTALTTGIIQIQNNLGLGSSAGGTTVASGTALQIDGSGLNIAEPITSIIGTGVSSSGALVNLANSNEWSGGVALGAGGATVTSNAGTLTLSGGITGAGRPLTIAGDGNTLINSVIGTGTGALVKYGSGLLTLTAANTYSGATTVSAGGLILSGNGTALSTSFFVTTSATLTLDNTITNNTDRIANNLTMNGGEFILLGNNAANTTESLGTLIFTTGYSTITITPDVNFNSQLTLTSLTRSTGAAVLFRGINLGEFTVASATANSSNIIFTGGLALSGAGLSGTTTVGIVSGVIGAGGVSGNISSGSDFLTYNPTGGSVNGLRPLLVSEYAATPAANVNLKLTANRTADDTFTLNSLLLSGGVNYDYDATAGANTLTIAGGNLLSIDGANSIQTTNLTSGNLIFTGEAKIYGVSDLVFGSNVPVTGTGSLSKNGPGTLTENRSVALTGGVRVNDGTLRAGINNMFSTAQAFTIFPTGVLDLNGFNQSVTTLSLNSGGVSGAIVTTGAGTLTLGGNLGLAVNGSGAFGATISGNLALGGTTRTFTINDGLAINDLTISANISDATAGLIKSGNGLLSLSGNNTYPGLVSITAGTLEAASATALGTTANGVTISAGTNTLKINNANIGAEALSFSNGNILSGTGTASLDGNITLTGTAAARTISTLLSTDTLTLNGTIDGLAAALTLSGPGTIKLNNTVGSVTPLTTITSNAGGTVEINGGLIQSSGAQTFNSIVNINTAPVTFTVTGANADILLANSLNNITQTINYAVSGIGTIRDISLGNNSATAVLPTLPSGLRNLFLQFNGAALDLPALTLTGTLTAFSAGGDLTQSGTLAITGATIVGSGAFNTILLDPSNNLANVSVNGGNDVSILDSTAFNFGGATSAVSGNLSIVSSGAISDSSRISAPTLTTSSIGGTALNFANHTISNFNATNTTSGGITFVNIVPLTLTGILQSSGGTTVSITNTGTVFVPDAVTIQSGTTMAITATDLDLNTTGAIQSGTTTTITQLTAGDSVALGNSIGTMNISGSELQRITATALTIAGSSDGAILVDGVAAADTANVTGAVTLNATAGTLGTISFFNNDSAFRTLTVTSDAGTTVGKNLSTTVGALNFTVNTGTLSVLDGFTASSATTLAVTANDLNLNTTGALSSTTTTSITENIVGGSIGLGNTAGTMSISGNELFHILATGLTLNAATDGLIVVDGITSANTANVSGAITLNATAGTLGTVAFINNDSAFRTLTVTSDAGTNVGKNLSTTVGALNFTVNTGNLAVLDGATAHSATTLAVTANDLDLNTTGALSSATTMSITENIAASSIGLGNTAGTMTISGSELQRMSATGLTFNAPTNGSIVVDGITSANSANISGTTTLVATAGTLGTIAFINNDSSFRALTVTSDVSTSVGTNLATTVGGLAFTVNTGNLSILDSMTAQSITTLAVTANDLNLNTSGALTSGTTMTITENIGGGSIGLGNTAGTMSISNSELQRMTAGALTLNAPNNGSILVDNISAADSANIAGVTTLNATAGTTGFISWLSASTFTNGLAMNADTALTLTSDVTTINSPLSISVPSLTINSILNAGSGNITLTATTGAITQGVGHAIFGGALTANASTGITLDQANQVTSFAATNTTNDILFVNQSDPATLTIAGITQNGSGMVDIINTGAMNVTGALTSNGGDINLTTLSPDNNERVLTVGNTINSNGGDINLDAANSISGLATAMIINAALSTLPGSGGSLTVTPGVTLNAALSLGAGNIILNAHGVNPPTPPTPNIVLPNINAGIIFSVDYYYDDAKLIDGIIAQLETLIDLASLDKSLILVPGPCVVVSIYPSISICGGI